MKLPQPPRFSRKLPYDRFLFEAFLRQRKGAFRRKYGGREWRGPRYERRQHESFDSMMLFLERFMRGGRRA